MTTSQRTASAPLLEAVDGEAAEEVGEGPDGPAAVQCYALEHADAVARAERLEIGDGEQVHVGRVVPLIRELGRNRHPSESDLQPQVPAAEVRERDDGFAPDAQHLEQDLLGAAHRLERLRQDHAVEGTGVEAREAPLEIALD